MAEELVLVGGARTPFGEHGGALKDVSATELGAFAARAALARTGVPAERIDNVVIGSVVQTDGQAAYLARHIALKAGIPVPTPALTVNRLCGSGLQAIVTAAQSIRLGESAWALAGGTESMSQVPHIVRGARYGLGLSSVKFEDMLLGALQDSYCGCLMAQTADNLVKQYGLTREEVDQYAAESQQRAAAAWAQGLFAHEVVPIPVQTRKGEVLFEKDEHLRPDTTPASLARLRPHFGPDSTVTAGNASGVVDGAAAVVITTRRAAEQAGLRPLSRIVSWAVVGVPPEIMGIGPAPASRAALEKAGLRVADVDLWEINEAFAGQVCAVRKDLGIPGDILNVNGGAVAVGHPLGASGTRLALTLSLELQRRGARYGVASLCIGGGQGIAAVFARI